MANELKKVSSHVNQTTAAVVTMEGAVVAAEVEGSKKVCTNVNRGFFSLIQSQISQKIASRHSRVEALLMHMAQQKRQLLGIKGNMEREYGRIAARYVKIFTGINKELEQRIRQIDQPVFELVTRHMATSSNRMNSLCSWVTTSQLESVSDSQKVLVSKMKHNAQVTLEQSKAFLEQVAEQHVIAQKVLLSSPLGNEDKVYQLPVMVTETIDGSAGIPRVHISTPDAVADASVIQISNGVKDQGELPWKHAAKPEEITKEFNLMLGASNVSSRVKEMIQKMYASSDFESL